MNLLEVRLNKFVYPGQALVSAYFILNLYDKLEEAAKDTGHGYCKAEGNAEIPGSGGVASDAIYALQNYKKYRDLNILIAELNNQWVRLTGPTSRNFEHNFIDGLTKSFEIEQTFINLVKEKEQKGFF